MVSIEEPDGDGSYGGEVWLSLENAIFLRNALTAAIDNAREWSQK